MNSETARLGCVAGSKRCN